MEKPLTGKLGGGGGGSHPLERLQLGCQAVALLAELADLRQVKLYFDTAFIDQITTHVPWCTLDCWKARPERSSVVALATLSLSCHRTSSLLAGTYGGRHPDPTPSS